MKMNRDRSPYDKDIAETFNLSLETLYLCLDSMTDEDFINVYLLSGMYMGSKMNGVVTCTINDESLSSEELYKKIKNILNKYLRKYKLKRMVD